MIERVFARGVVSTKVLTLQNAETLYRDGFDIEMTE